MASGIRRTNRLLAPQSPALLLGMSPDFYHMAAAPAYFVGVVSSLDSRRHVRVLSRRQRTLPRGTARAGELPRHQPPFSLCDGTSRRSLEPGPLWTDARRQRGSCTCGASNLDVTCTSAGVDPYSWDDPAPSPT